MTVHPDPRLLDEGRELTAERRASLLRHVSGCSRCRDRLAGRDPSRLFAMLSTVRIPDGALERLSDRVEDQLDLVPTSRMNGGWLRTAGGLAAAALLALAFAGWLPGPAVAPVVAPAGAPAGSAALEPSTVLLPTNAIRLLDSPSGQTQVVDLRVGETQVVMIFDEGLDI